MTEPTISLAAFRAMVETLLEYVPYGQRENARAAALAVGIGYAYPARSQPRVRGDNPLIESDGI